MSRALVYFSLWLNLIMAELSLVLASIRHYADSAKLMIYL